MKKISLILLAVTASLAGLVSLANSIGSSAQERETRLKQIESSSTVQIYADNTTGSQLYIKEATVKEVSGDDFKIMVAEIPRHSILTTYPDVTLLNNSAKTIKSFVMIIQSSADRPKDGHFLMQKNLSIAPSATFKVMSKDWPMPERVSIQKDGEFKNGLRQPGLDKAESWIPGAASDLRITVAMIDFADGSRWMIPPDYSGHN